MRLAALLVLFSSWGYAQAQSESSTEAPISAPPASEQATSAEEKSASVRNDENAESKTSQTGPQLTKAPELIQFAEAQYPEIAQSNKIAGDVLLLFTITEAGSVKDVEVLQGLGYGLDEAAVAAAQEFRFSPAEVDGQPSPVRIQYRYSFSLKTEVKEVEAKPEPKLGRLVGRILLRGEKTPLQGFQVSLESGEETLTDEKGRFAFAKVSVGEVIVTIEEDGFETTVSAEEVVEGKETDVTYYVDRKGFDGTVTVRAKRVKKEVVRRTVTVEEIRMIPGTNGDALAVVQNLPGAARSSFGNTELVFRGGGQTQVYLNQQPIPLAFHFGGIRSTVASGLIENIDLYPSNYGVEYSRVNGGVIDIQLRRPKTDRIHGVFEADVFDAGLLLEGPLGDDGAIAVAFRRSYFDVLFGAFVPEDSGITIQTLPRYYDSQLVYDWRKNGHTFNATLYGSSDRFEAVFDEPVDEEPRVRGEAVFALEWVGGQSKWGLRLDDSLTNELSVAWLTTWVEVRFGQLVDLDFEFMQALVRDTVTYKPNEDVTLRLGTDLNITGTDIYAFGSGGPPKEGEPDNNGPATDEAIETEFQSTDAAIGLFTDLDYAIGNLRLIPGLRYDYLGQTKEHFFLPRFTTRYELTKQSVLKGAIGDYIQPPQGDELAIGDGPKPKAETSRHYALGWEQQLSELLFVDLSLFYKSFDQLVRRKESQNIEFENTGVGRAYGLELLLRHQMGARFFGWVAYTLQRSERRDSPSENWRPFDTDQTHNLIVLGQYRITPKWSLGVRWRFVTGNPETPVTGAIYEADRNTYVPTFGAINSSRQPNFTQLDIRIDRTWTFDTWRLMAYLDVRNALNEANSSERIYSYDFSEEARGTEIPIVPSFGLRGTF